MSISAHNLCNIDIPSVSRTTVSAFLEAAIPVNFFTRQSNRPTLVAFKDTIESLVGRHASSGRMGSGGVSAVADPISTH